MKTNRRNFIKKTAAGAAALGITSAFPTLHAGILGANEKLVCGVIGVNGMGFADLRAFLNQPGTECAALCDVDDNVLQQRIADVKEIQGTAPAGYHDFRKLLEHRGLDVIIIGTPDHWHTLPFVYAAQQGYDIYCEKPLANSIEECNLMERAVERYGNVVQVGQWQRSDPHWQDAIAYVHAGNLGKIRSVRAWSYQGWMKSVPVVPDSPVPGGVDYDFWLGPAPKRPFNKNRFHFTFRWFWDYAGGMMTDWGVHIMDYALFGMRQTAPKSVMSMGGKFAYPDDACETPDTQQAIYEFDGFTLLWDHGIGIDGGYYGRSHGVGFVGNDGTLVVDRTGWEVIPEPKEGNPTLERVPLVEGKGMGLENHMANFMAAIRNGAELNCPIEIAAGVARTCHLGNIAYKTGRRLYWDADRNRFLNDPGADSYLSPSYREPWSLPVL
ncbi:MAG TPA: twin-arginine translocation signal domain-containing protein [Bacteroides sp.]|nr:twin-arginine translocation signal domain-containing protein [Bacteroides sp.]